MTFEVVQGRGGCVFGVQSLLRGCPCLGGGEEAQPFTVTFYSYNIYRCTLYCTYTPVCIGVYVVPSGLSIFSEFQLLW